MQVLEFFTHEAYPFPEILFALKNPFTQGVNYSSTTSKGMRSQWLDFHQLQFVVFGATSCVTCAKDCGSGFPMDSNTAMICPINPKTTDRRSGFLQNQFFSRTEQFNHSFVVRLLSMSDSVFSFPRDETGERFLDVQKSWNTHSHLPVPSSSEIDRSLVFNA